MFRRKENDKYEKDRDLRLVDFPAVEGIVFFYKNYYNSIYKYVLGESAVCCVFYMLFS